ncbi:MAG TPA: hypothetical protein VK695_00345 [Steroidobacteraceae bacterium]|jgi:hypothetical protein|nr:hypothetical protein [Steroidobacteraceae bacterium]
MSKKQKSGSKSTAQKTATAKGVAAPSADPGENRKSAPSFPVSPPKK